jgi:hypothetical protein
LPLHQHALRRSFLELDWRPMKWRAISARP